MVRRTHSSSFKEQKLSYKDCEICEEWKYFSKFKAWMETQDWEGKELDKDLIVRGNKLYSPETCAFIDRKINTFIVESLNKTNGLPIGVMHYRDRYKALLKENNKSIYLGIYDKVEDAYEAWLSYKLKQAKELAATISDNRVAKALVERYENYKID